MNISSEVILGAISACGLALAGAVAKMWIWFTSELNDCKEDRKNLHGKVEVLHTEITSISKAVGRLEGKSETGETA